MPLMLEKDLRKSAVFDDFLGMHAYSTKMQTGVEGILKAKRRL